VQARRLLSVVWESLDATPEGRVWLRRRYTGLISAPMNLADFPVDRHVVRLHFAAPGTSARELTFAIDPERTGQSRSMTVADWTVGPGSARPAPFVVPELAFSVPGFSYDMPVTRRCGFYFWSLVSPLVLIVVMSWAVFWLDSVRVGERLGISTTAILTLIAYRFALGTQLPRLSYPTRMDVFLLGATILVFLAFLEVVVLAGLARAKKDGAARRVERICRGAAPAALLGIIVWSFLL
jgi:hypothetical protein